MTWFKACPRCIQGDMYLDEDICRHCLQCGYIQPSTDNKSIAYQLAVLLGFDDGKREPVAADALEQVPALAS